MDISIRVGVLLRHEDESGVSGAGIVADVIEYPDGWCVAHWRSNVPSTNVYPNYKALATVHGHGGKTEVVWITEIDAPNNLDELRELLEELREEELEELAAKAEAKAEPPEPAPKEPAARRRRTKE